MIDFLKEADISDNVINEIINNNNSEDIISLESNKEECLTIISCFRNIGIKNIDELLINEAYIFCKSMGQITSGMSKYDIGLLVDEINNDYTAIEKIL